MTCASRGTRRSPRGKSRRRSLTAKTGWWPFATKQYFDPVSWEADLRRIVRLYETRGYYQARIAGEQAIPQPKGVSLEVKIDEGQVTKVGSLEVRGLEALPAGDREAALVKMPLKVGVPFEESDWESAKSGIVPRLHERGYAKVTVEGEALVDVKTHLAAVTIVVHPGVSLPLRPDRREDRARGARPGGVRLGTGTPGDRTRGRSTATRRWRRLERRSSGWACSAA